MRRVRDTLRLWFSLRLPVGRRDYLVWGLTLMVAKYLVDATVMRLAANVFWSPIDYLNPTGTVRDVRTELTPWIRTPLFLWTLPFLWIGASMTVRRAVDAGRSAWSGLMFFVPVLNYVVMIILCFMPSRPPIAPSDVPAPSGPATPAIDRRLRSAMLGLGVSLAIGLTLAVLCTVVFKSYGLSVFFGTPFVASVVSGFVHNRYRTRPVRETVLVATTGLLLVAGALLLFAVEGMVCVVMGFPLAVPIAAMGGLFGRQLARQRRGNLAPATLAVLAIPLLAGLETRLPALPPPVHEVVSSVDVAAPPEVVWRHVVSFDELPPPHELLFRLGVAYPQRATIRGHGVGALRRCEFSTGAFVEPITAWDAPRRLTFDVTEQPDPMRELSPWRHVVAPHMADGFRAIRGEFRLSALPDGGTRLAGSTWYVLRIQPRSYWSLWADGFVGTIHLRVLEHIRREAETEWIGPEAAGPKRLSPNAFQRPTGWVEESERRTPLEGSTGSGT
ncbi:MAG TPA: SRPBCC family protein [Candidatus Eisenbacteria bacterium]|nr:SRPBCC family protein [Candidatus Eisenbacteria bacterium]